MSRLSKVLMHLLLTIAMAAAATALAVRLLQPAPPPARDDPQIAISLLRSEMMSFLVTRRTITQVVVEHEESDWLGEWRGVLWVKVVLRWGVDLGSLTPQDITRRDDAWVVRLPEPQMLDFGIVPGSSGCMTKATAAPKLLDFLKGGTHRQFLEAQVNQQAMSMAAEAGMLPSRAEIVNQLNEAAGVIFQATATKVVFE